MALFDHAVRSKMDSSALPRQGPGRLEIRFDGRITTAQLCHKLLQFSGRRHRWRRPSSTPTSATAAIVPKRADLEPVRMMWTAASVASSPAPATRVENRCVKTSKSDAFGGSEGRGAENATGVGWG